MPHIGEISITPHGLAFDIAHMLAGLLVLVSLMMLFFFCVDWVLALGERWLIGASG